MSTRLSTSRRLSAVVALAAAGLLTVGAASAFAQTDVSYSTFEGFPSDIDIDGEANVDIVSVSLSGNTITITDTGPGGITTAATECTAVNATTVTCPFDPPDPAPPADPFFPVDDIDADLFEANDAFTSSAPIVTDVTGGDGDDNLSGGPDDDDLDGDEGNDTLNGNDGNDDLEDGHTGFTTGGNDIMIGGNGRDSAGGTRRELPTSITLDGAANDGFPSLGEADNLDVEEFDGSDADDTLIGDANTNGVQAFDGNDVVMTGGGSDTMGGGPGDDQIDPGPGVDDVHCGAGLDTALLTPGDFVAIGDFGTTGVCERTGAEIAGESVTVKGKVQAHKAKAKGGSAKVRVSCGADEGAPCAGKVVLLSNGKKISKKGRYSVGAGKTKNAKLTLSKKGAKKLDQAGGSLLVTAEARTTYPLGKSVNEARVMLVGAR